jgi:hypothetical protein
MGGTSADVLRQFEDVRGVRRVRVKGSVPGFEGYVAWLVRRMMRAATSAIAGSVGDGEGAEEEEYVPVDEAERRRLGGWV